MQLINELIQELVHYSSEWNNNKISKDELNIKLDLISNRLKLIEIDFSNDPLYILDSHVMASFNQILYQTQYKAIQSLNTLKDTDDKRSYNASLRRLLESKFYFKSLNSTMQKNVHAYIKRNKLRYVSARIQVFILGEEKEMLINE